VGDWVHVGISVQYEGIAVELEGAELEKYKTSMRRSIPTARDATMGGPDVFRGAAYMGAVWRLHAGKRRIEEKEF